MMVPPSRAKALAWARDTIARPDVLYLDSETQGLGDDARILDIAVIDNSGAVLMDRLVWCPEPIPAQATAVHGITDAMLEDAPGWEEVYDELRLILHDRVVCVYNADYDRARVEWMNAEYGLPRIPVVSWQCAMKAHADFAAKPGRYPGQFRWHKLSDAAAMFGIEPGTHRALADAVACLEVVKAMAAYEDEDERAAWKRIDERASHETLCELRRIAVIHHHISSDRLKHMTGGLETLTEDQAQEWITRLQRPGTQQPALFETPATADAERWRR